MATGGQLSSSVAGASDEYYEFTCSPCKQESKFMEAEVFCEDCSEYLCRQCLKFHNKFEKMKAHRMVDKDGMKAQGHRKPLSAPTETCEKHHGRFLDIYCRDHDVICCVTCVSLNHITCKGRVYLADAAEGISSSKAMTTFNDTLGKLKVKLTRLEKEKRDALEESDKESTRAKNKVLKSHHLIIDHLAKLVEASLTDIEERYTERKSVMKNDVKMVTEMISEIHDIEESIDPSKEKNETKVFVNMKRHTVSLDSFNDDLARLQNANRDKWEFLVTQQILDITEQVASFGQLETPTQVCCSGMDVLAVAMGMEKEIVAVTDKMRLTSRKLCIQPGCNRYGDPAQANRCSQHYQEAMAIMPPGLSAESLQQFNDRTDTSTKTRAVKNGACVRPKSVPNNRIAMETEPSPQLGPVMAALSKVGSSRKSNKLCKNNLTQTCQNYGNSKNKGYCNTCYPDFLRSKRTQTAGQNQFG